MSKIIEVSVPDIGDFKDVPVIEVLVRPGQQIERDASLIALESEKSTMEIPAPQAGTVKSVRLKVGDKVSQGSEILAMEVETGAPAERGSRAPPSRRRPTRCAPGWVVLGTGTGGLCAAFRAADLGEKVVLVERYGTLGGVCLDVGASLQDPAARRQGDLRGGGSGRPRRQLRQAAGRPRPSYAPGRTAWSNASPAVWRNSPNSATCR